MGMSGSSSSLSLSAVGGGSGGGGVSNNNSHSICGPNMSSNNKQMNSNNNTSNNSVVTVVKTDRITLMVDETPFVVDAKLFANHHNTLLGRMFGNKNFELKPNSRGEYDIGRGTCLTSSVFRLILVR